MPEINNTFSKGSMNQDLDERIVPNGQYREAMNIQVSTSEGADIGSAQNILGNTNVENIVLGGGWTTVGGITDEKNNELYWFVHSAGVDAILRYKTDTQTVDPVLVDINQNVLNFTGNLITGINIIDDILMWTDNNSEPKKININRCIQGSTDLSTHTKLVVNNSITTINITEDHITVIKKRPNVPPKTTLVRPAGQQEIESTVDFTDGNGNLLSAGDTAYILSLIHI